MTPTIVTSTPVSIEPLAVVSTATSAPRIHSQIDAPIMTLTPVPTTPLPVESLTSTRTTPRALTNKHSHIHAADIFSDGTTDPSPYDTISSLETASNSSSKKDSIACADETCTGGTNDPSPEDEMISLLDTPFDIPTDDDPTIMTTIPVPMEPPIPAQITSAPTTCSGLYSQLSFPKLVPMIPVPMEPTTAAPTAAPAPATPAHTKPQPQFTCLRR